MSPPQRLFGGAPRRAVFLWVALLVGAVLPALFAASCAAPEPDWNVLVVTFDTTRADHIGSYGHATAQTPTIDRLAADGVLFEEAMVPVPMTLPSHSSLMTGKVPPAHGVRDNGLFALGEEQVTLAEILRDAGYRTAAAIGSFPLLRRFGLDQGFDLYDDQLTSPYEDLFGRRIVPNERLYFDERRATRVNEAILPWLSEPSDRPFLLWLHYFDPHHPLEPPPPYDQLFAHEPYDGEIAYADESLGAVLRHLRTLGLEEDTLIVFTSDHGEGRGEHNESTHSLLAYQSTLHVPLVIRLPGGPRGLRVAERVSTVDVLPTVLAALGLEAPEDIQGVSLLPLVEGSGQASRSRPLYAETLSPRLTQGWGELRALVIDGKKYIHGPRPELFDLDRDPQELTDLVAEQEELATGLRGRLERYLQDNAASDLDSSIALDDEAVRRLQALGYLHASGAAPRATEERLRADGDPPQDHAGTVTALSEAKNLLFQGRALEAQRFLGDLLRADPDNPYYLELLLAGETRLGDHDGALDILQRLEGLDSGGPRPAKRHNLRGDILLARGELKAAYRSFREAEALEPSVDGQYRLALLHRDAGQHPEAVRFLHAALELDPAFAPAHVDLAIRSVAEGELEAAEDHLSQALEADPFFARAHYNYAALLVDTGRLEQAATRFERAAQLRPGYRRAHAALVEVLLRLDRTEEARERFAQLERIAPDAAETRLARRLLEGVS